MQLGAERHRAPELLFTPELVGLEYAGVHQVVVDSINRADLDLRKSLFGNVVLSGGGTLVKGGVSLSLSLVVGAHARSYAGFGDRLLHEVKKLALRETKIRISAPPERKYSTWIGGSILAGLSTFKKMWVSAEEYQEGECWRCWLEWTRGADCFAPACRSRHYLSERVVRRRYRSRFVIPFANERSRFG